MEVLACGKRKIPVADFRSVNCSQLSRASFNTAAKSRRVFSVATTGEIVSCFPVVELSSGLTSVAQTETFLFARTGISDFWLLASATLDPAKIGNIPSLVAQDLERPILCHTP